MKKISAMSFSRRLQIATLAVALALAGATVLGAHKGKVSGLPVENFGKVNENYYRGAQPDAEGFAELKRLGIKTVIDLRKDRQAAAPGQVRALGMQYFNIPMKSSKAATPEQTDYFFKLVNDPANWPVYVHCKGGRHRTGALTAAYRIVHDGWTADQAFEEMKKYDFNSGLFGGPADQKRFVYSFYQQHTAATGRK
jgi:protein tyrosine phosphatase (PTP) superfamily phosphohydrolase (DUF442 family)